MTAEEVINILQMQEEILQFTHFTNEDAWELGSLIVAEGKKRQIPLMASIKRTSGLTLFRYCSDHVTLQDEQCLERKFHTVRAMEKSSLLLYSMFKKNEEKQEDYFLDPAQYYVVGGAFPVRVEDVGVVGTVVVNGMDHVAGHDLIVKCISKYLHIDEVARIKAGMIK